MEQIAAYIGAIVAAIVAAVITARRTTNGITGNIQGQLAGRDETSTTLRESVDEIRDNVSLVLDGVNRMDSRLFVQERKLDDVSKRVTVLEKWKESA